MKKERQVRVSVFLSSLGDLENEVDRFDKVFSFIGEGDETSYHYFEIGNFNDFFEYNFSIRENAAILLITGHSFRLKRGVSLADLMDENSGVANEVTTFFENEIPTFLTKLLGRKPFSIDYFLHWGRDDADKITHSLNQTILSPAGISRVYFNFYRCQNDDSVWRKLVKIESWKDFLDAFTLPCSTQFNDSENLLLKTYTGQNEFEDEVDRKWEFIINLTSSNEENNLPYVNIFDPPTRYSPKSYRQEVDKVRTAKQKKSELKFRGHKRSSQGDFSFKFVRFYDRGKIDEEYGPCLQKLEGESLDTFKNVTEVLKDKVLKDNFIKAGEDEIPDFYIAFAKMEDFNDSKMYHEFSFARCFCEDVQEGQGNHKTYVRFVPVITIGLMNIMSYDYGRDFLNYFDDNPKTENTEVGSHINHAHSIYRLLNLDKRFRFFDSSIWLHYVPVTRHFEEEMKLALSNISYNLENDIYSTMEAVEFMQFHLRLLRHSYVDNVSNGLRNAPYITPFVFHPESRMRRLSIMELANIREFDWEFLLVDDQIGKKRTLYQVPDGGTIKRIDICKRIIVENALNGKHFEEYHDGELDLFSLNSSTSSFKINTLTNPEDAYSRLVNKVENGGKESDLLAEKETIVEEKDSEEEEKNNKRFGTPDIIFMNYLFEPKEGAYREGDTKHGFDFIRKLYRLVTEKGGGKERMENREKGLRELRKALGPFQKLNILPVSNFEEAMQLKLQSMGVPLEHRYWHIEKGVDPICTPHLFRYRVFNMLSNMVSDYVRLQNEMDVKRKLIENKGNQVYDKYFFEKTQLQSYYKYKKPISRLDYIFENIVKEEGKIKLNADIQLSRITLLNAKLLHLDSFRHEEMGKDVSPFVESLMNNYFLRLRSNELEHFRHLVYLLISARYLQLDMLWDELMHVSQIIRSKGDNSRYSLRKSIEISLKEITKYVSEIKNKSIGNAKR